MKEAGKGLEAESFQQNLLNNPVGREETFSQTILVDYVKQQFSVPTFHDSSDDQKRETCPIFDTSVPEFSKLKSTGQSRGIETTTDLAQNDNPEKLFNPITETETACEPIPQPSSRHCDKPSTSEIKDPTTESIPQNELSHYRGGKYNLRPNPNPNYSIIYRY